MKITFVLPYASLAGGIRVAAIYAKKLVERGHDVTVVSQPRKHLPIAKQFARRALGRGRRGGWGSGTHQLDFLGDKHVVLKQNRPVTVGDLPDADVIIATWWETAFEVAALPASKGKKFYFIQHHEVHDHLPAHISGGSYHLPLKKITISQWLVDVMADKYDDTAVALVENSVDMSQFYAPERGKGTPPTVGLLYSTTKFKGLDISLKALGVAKKSVPDLRVVGFGDQDIDPALPLPAGASYFKKPAQEKIRDIYAMCDVWLCGSRSEGFHLPPLEAMACRCPVVSTRVGGPLEIIENGVNGFIVDVQDSTALGARLVDVLSLSDDAWSAMSDAAHVRAQSYTWDDAADKFERVLVECSV